ncbi:MAG: HAMP domain-containing histidine kinase [Acidobacteriia bacterium]|nr:HAMP domain-containing histidine kinase [Terriglobia bacterium]
MKMRPATKERVFWWTAVPALAGVLVFLAVLQYHWSQQVSDASREQMLSNLQTALTGFRLDLTHELGAACLEVRSAVRESANQNSTRFGERFQHWQQTATHPALVSQIFLWQSIPVQSNPGQTSRPSQDNQGRLVRLFPVSEHNDKDAVSWPPEFQRLQQRLQAMSQPTDRPGNGGPRFFRNNRGRGRGGAGPRGGTGPRDGAGSRAGRPNRSAGTADAFLPWFVDQSIPALASPVRQRDEAGGDTASPASVSWIIIQLNPGVLEKEIFPELAQKYFGGTGGLSYHVAVVDQSAQAHALYASVAGFGGSSDQAPDAALDLFGPPLRRNGPAVAVGPQDVFGPRTGTTATSGRPRQAQNPNGDRRDSGGERMVRLEPIRYSSDDGVWKVVVKHPSGSVEAAVSGLRRHNLAVSFGVLVLLAVTMGLVVAASQRARRLAMLQMDFVAGVSHELRTPLAVISSAAENIAHGVVADKQQLARYGASIVKQARQLAQLVDQVLVFAATQQKPQRYPLRAVNVSEVLSAALENTASVVTAAGVSVERNLEPGLPPVSADFAALSQCLQNLITNAVKYGGDGRWVGIRAAARKEGDAVREVEITVQDHGMGMSQEELKHIFEPFYRSPSVAGSSIHGTGLGLPLAKTVIEAMRGTLAVESEPGKGSAFTIRLAVADGLRESHDERAAKKISGQTAGETP